MNANAIIPMAGTTPGKLANLQLSAWLGLEISHAYDYTIAIQLLLYYLSKVFTVVD